MECGRQTGESQTYLSRGELSQELLRLGLRHLEASGDLDGDTGILGGNQSLSGTGVVGVGVEDLK